MRVRAVPRAQALALGSGGRSRVAGLLAALPPPIAQTRLCVCFNVANAQLNELRFVIFMVNLKSRSCWLILLVGSKTRGRSRRGGRDLHRRFRCRYSRRQDKRRRRTCGRGGLGGSAPPAPAPTSASPAGHRGRLCTPPRPKSAARGRRASGSGGGGRPGRPARAGTRRGLRPARASCSVPGVPAASEPGRAAAPEQVPSARSRPPRPGSPRARAQDGAGRGAPAARAGRGRWGAARLVRALSPAPCFLSPASARCHPGESAETRRRAGVEQRPRRAGREGRGGAGERRAPGQGRGPAGAREGGGRGRTRGAARGLLF